MAYFDLKRILENISYEPQLTLLAQITKDEKNGDFVDRRRFCINDQWYILVDSSRAKVVVGPDYNFIFIKESGFFQRWGRTVNDDPLYSPIGPEILDIEISVNGCPNACPFCSPEGTLVLTPVGVKQIEQVSKGDIVLGFDVSSEEITQQEVVETYDRYYEGDMIDIELNNGRILSLTPEHLVFTKNRGEIEAQFITVKDDIIGF